MGRPRADIQFDRRLQAKQEGRAPTRGGSGRGVAARRGPRGHPQHHAAEHRRGAQPGRARRRARAASRSTGRGGQVQVGREEVQFDGRVAAVRAAPYASAPSSRSSCTLRFGRDRIASACVRLRRARRGSHYSVLLQGGRRNAIANPSAYGLQLDVARRSSGVALARAVGRGSRRTLQSASAPRVVGPHGGLAKQWELLAATHPAPPAISSFYQRRVLRPRGLHRLQHLGHGAPRCAIAMSAALSASRSREPRWLRHLGEVGRHRCRAMWAREPRREQGVHRSVARPRLWSRPTTALQRRSMTADAADGCEHHAGREARCPACSRRHGHVLRRSLSRQHVARFRPRRLSV